MATANVVTLSIAVDGIVNCVAASVDAVQNFTCGGYVDDGACLVDVYGPLLRVFGFLVLVVCCCC